MSGTLYIVVVGCVRLGRMLASRLSGEGNKVSVLDSDEADFKALTAKFSGLESGRPILPVLHSSTG